MKSTLREVLADSHVSAFAIAVPNIFTAPVASWILRREYRGFTERTTLLPGFSLLDALPELIRPASLLLVWYILLRWLCFKPVKKETDEPTPDSEQGA